MGREKGTNTHTWPALCLWQVVSPCVIAFYSILHIINQSEWVMIIRRWLSWLMLTVAAVEAASYTAYGVVWKLKAFSVHSSSLWVSTDTFNRCSVCRSAPDSADVHIVRSRIRFLGPRFRLWFISESLGLFGGEFVCSHSTFVFSPKDIQLNW